jgi:hypothetical protein
MSAKSCAMAGKAIPKSAAKGGSRIKRAKLDRKIDLKLDGDRVVDMPPDWAFTIVCPNHGEYTFDFNPFRAGGRDDLAGHLRDAIWNLRHESEGRTLYNYFAGIGCFHDFLTAIATSSQVITRLDQIDKNVLLHYIAWLGTQISTNGANKGQPLSIGTQKKRYDAIKSLLTNRQKRHSTAVSPDLSFPQNPFPNSNSKAEHRPPYSINEQDRITAALNADLKRIHSGGEPLAPDQVLVVHLIILGLALGANLQSMIELRRNSLLPGAAAGRRFFQLFKRRGHSSHAMSVRAEEKYKVEDIKAVPENLAEHFDFLCSFTAPLMADAPQNKRDFVFLVRMKNGARKGQVIALGRENSKKCVQSFRRRHALKDDLGQPLKLSVARLRPTMGSNLYRITKDIRKVSRELGHANVQITETYVDTRLEAERDHRLVIEDLEQRFTPKKIDGKIMIAADGQFPSNMQNLLDGGYNSGIARCKNPFRGKTPEHADATVVEEIESICKKFLACFKCPNMMVFEDDLWRLFSFEYRLLSERSKIHPDHWLKTYAPIIRRIDRQIAPLFPDNVVAEARAKAIQTPHPTWRGPIL